VYNVYVLKYALKIITVSEFFSAIKNKLLTRVLGGVFFTYSLK